MFEAVSAEGIYLVGADGERYADFASGQINVNVGYGHPHVIAGMEAQLRKVAYVAPSIATAARQRLAELVADHTPNGLDHVFFTNTGAEAVEAAIKVARRVTGRAKVYSAWRSYHGATSIAGAVSGDPRRHFNEPGPPSTAKFHYPACYRCAFGQVGPTTCAAPCLRSLEQQIILDGPETIAAVLMEPIAGTSGVYVPPAWFLQGLRKLCTSFGIMLLLDETLTGWGRTGRWFACEHFGVTPDILITAKGLTSGYAPLGAVVMNSATAAVFDETPFVSGSTTEGHALSCAAGVANVEVYQSEGLVRRSESLGLAMLNQLQDMASSHECVGDVRGQGLLACVELTRDRASRSPLAGYRNSNTEIASLITERLRAFGIIVLAKWDFIFFAPPLTVGETQIADAVGRLDQVLSYIDEAVLPSTR